MRICSKCSVEDRPWFDGAECSCGAPANDDAPLAPGDHGPDCKGIGHEVVLYHVRLLLSDFTYDASGDPLLSKTWVSRSWHLKRNGGRYYRVKMLCRACIELEESAQMRRRDYDKACRAAIGLENSTYAQMIALQTMI